jgi:hypothetical protein
MSARELALASARTLAIASYQQRIGVGARVVDEAGFTVVYA